MRQLCCLSGAVVCSLWIATAHAAAPFVPAIAATSSTGAAERPVLPAANHAVNGRNVVRVDAPGGSFIHTGNGTWVEQGHDGSTFNFVETRRDDWSVYLHDASRNVNLQLDLHRGLILFAEGNQPMQPLYQIVGALSGAAEPPTQGQIGAAFSSEIIEYNCNEGIPLIARFENEGDQSWVYFSHDSLPEVRLEQVVSASGARYSNGYYTLDTKGDEAVLRWEGTEDFCYRN